MNDKAARTRNAALNFSILLLFVAVFGLLASGYLKGCGSPVNPLRVADPGILIGEIIQVEVLNGCGRDGLASAMMGYLRSRGFDVVSSGNHTTFGIEKTQILNRISDDSAAGQVATALGLGSGDIVSEPREDLYVDASVLIGCDYASIPPFSL